MQPKIKGEKECAKTTKSKLLSARVLIEQKPNKTVLATKINDKQPQ